MTWRWETSVMGHAFLPLAKARQTDRQTEPAYVCTKTRTDRQTYRQTELGAIARARARGGSDLENLRRV